MQSRNARNVASTPLFEKCISALPPPKALISLLPSFTRSLLDARLRVGCVRNAARKGEKCNANTFFSSPISHILEARRLLPSPPCHAPARQGGQTRVFCARNRVVTQRFRSVTPPSPSTLPRASEARWTYSGILRKK